LLSSRLALVELKGCGVPALRRDLHDEVRRPLS
jgi:hypothetical protein